MNNAYFAESDLDFAAITKSGQLTFTKPTDQKIVGLAVGDVIQFQDNYGKKGLIKVTEIKGKFGLGDYIKLDIKIQP